MIVSLLSSKSIFWELESTQELKGGVKQMNILGFVIGTGTLWILEVMVVNPLSRLLSNLSPRVLQLSLCGDENEATHQKTKPDVPTLLYIVVDVLVLGLAGFVLSLALGWFFIGVAGKTRGWPGMIAFIVLSIAGATIHG